MSVHAFILAGGQSSRMGADKGLVLYHHQPLVQYVIDAVQGLTDRLCIVTANPHYAQFGYPLLPDLQPGLGPAGAIDTILQQSTADSNLVLACDMPFIDRRSIQYLLDQHTVQDITVPLYRNYPEALFGLYATRCAARWHERVAGGMLKLSGLLSAFATTFVDGEQLCSHNPDLFRNVNTPADL